MLRSALEESVSPGDIQELIEEVGSQVRFRLSALGAVVTGWLRGAVLDNQEIGDAGEIKYVETPIRLQNQGISKDLIRHALKLMRERGSTKVIMGAISEEGAGLIQSLRRHGIFGRLLAKKGMDGVYEIPDIATEGLAKKVLSLCFEARGDHSDEEFGYWIGDGGISELVPGETHMDYLFEDPQSFGIDMGDHEYDDGEFLWEEAMRLGWIAARKVIISGDIRWWVRCINLKRSRDEIERFADYVLEEGQGEGYERVSVYTKRDVFESTLSKIASGYLREVA